MNQKQLEAICGRQKAQIRELKAEMQRREALHYIKLFTVTEQAAIDADALRAEIRRLERQLQVKSKIIDGFMLTNGAKERRKEG